MSAQGPLQWVAIAALGVLMWRLFRIQQANALANSRNLTIWLALGAALTALVAFLVDTTSLVGPPLAAGLMMLWAAPAISLLMSRSQRLMTGMEHALNRGDLKTAEKLLGKATAAVRASSPVDLDWNRIQLCQLEERLRMAQGRAVEAVAPLEESYLRARGLGIPLYLDEAGNLLLICYCCVNPGSQAMHVLGSAASVHAALADTISARNL